MDAQTRPRRFVRRETEAFTRLELAATISALALLGALALPLLATTRADSERAACFNNLRQIGRGVRMWASEHEERVPWLTPTSQGGEGFGPRLGGAWIEYRFLSNELVTPRILACPADKRVKVATTWDLFDNAGFRNAATSYFVGLHVFPNLSRTILSTDRNLRTIPVGNCVVGVNNTLGVFPGAVPPASWTNDVHGFAGHLLFSDGSVEFTSSERLQQVITDTPDSEGVLHFVP
jgi:hypothetical protein